MSFNIRDFEQRLAPDPARVVIRPFHIAPEPRDLYPTQTHRARRIVDAVLALSAEECARELAIVDADFETRHWQTQAVYERRYHQIMAQLDRHVKVDLPHRELIGAYFCHEYSYAAAAIMNPSVTPHPDQSGLRPGDARFLLSLRTVGEGHISSIAFREGILTAANELSLWPEPAFSVAAEADKPEQQGAVTASRHENTPISGTVLFPFTRAQRNGLEDLRLVRFIDDDTTQTYFGSYTAYSGAGIGSELLETKTFRKFKLSPMIGNAAGNKGLALFPKRISGAYAAIGRQDGESLYFLQSDDPLNWNGGEKIMAPVFPWELVQIGNCGSPIELDEGWLLLTHGVGAMRKYSIGAALLDKNDPRKLIGRLRAPLISPSNENREGYVPNVLYTCGAMKHGDWLFLPYGVADTAVAFSLVEIKSILEMMV